MPSVSDDFDSEMRTTVEKINRMPPALAIKSQGNGTTQTPISAYDFQEMGERIAEAMLQAAREQLTEAENMYKQTEQFAADMKQRAADKAAELADLNNRLRIFGAAIVTAHKVFCGDVAKDKPT